MEIKVGLLSWEELQDLQKTVAREIEIRREKRKDEALLAAQATAKKYGYDLEDLLPGPKPRAKKVFKPKYRHPEKPELTWTGLGRQPKWLIAAVELGHSLEEMQIS